MEYFSLTNPSEISTFSNAVVNGIAPDRGLYFPKEIPQLPKTFIEYIHQMDIHEMALTAIRPFVEDEIPLADLERIVNLSLIHI